MFNTLLNVILLGGTVDITVHEVHQDGSLKEIHKASGGGWGGIMVDQAFEELLIELVGKGVYDAFTTDETEDYLDLWRLFEVKKKTVEPSMTSKVVMKLSSSLRDLYENQTGFSLEEAIKETKYASEIEVRRDKLIMKSSIVKPLFDKSVNSTVAHVKKIVSDCPKIRAILMVGGFSESVLLKEAVKKAFPEVEVICPQDASSAILRGAVIFGHNPTAVTNRVLRKTYGVDVDTAFVDGVHAKSRLRIIEGRRICMKTFQKFAVIGQTVKVGEDQFVNSYLPTYNDSDSEDLAIYASDLRDPKYVDEGCTYVGKLIIDLTSLPKHLNKSEKKLIVRLSLSDTEIKASVHIVHTGEIITGTFDFLG